MMEEEGFYKDIYFDTDEEDESIGLGLPKNKKSKE